ncbi:type I glutamate--ammonia ligase [Fusibacter paucivorans]|uniref:Glutamine synthetase n=1 Tax=Fusibacter paucivorans TaxID=76009 RepID=A0ABS5PNC2_9FIRM|nr:type I glutamate--ammonia ligase [Fusibacter paucivorans]MBS7526066.1 type I glutamate--ammonia ligase [Fusibacter paucivorans]
MKYISDEKKELMDLIEALDVELIHLQFTDIIGIPKNVTIMAHQLNKVLESGITFDGSSIDGFVRVEESDMYLRPDITTFTVFPWTSSPKEARMICDVYNMDGTPFEGCPRYILKQAVKESEALGYTMNVGPECEFFLFHTDSNGVPSLEVHDQASYFDLAPMDMGGNARNDISLTLKQMGFKIEASHHEVAPGQHEIDFEYADALKTADNIMTFKMVVRIIAQRHGLHATFMPKPHIGISGSGMHLNISLSNPNGTNAFYDPKDELQMSSTAYHFLGGLLTHAKAFTALTNPTVNSYKRLVPGYEAPILIAWSLSNRSPLIRVPSGRSESTRLELRSPDPSANPYLALAATLKAGLDGIKNKIEPPAQISNNLYEYSDTEIDELNIERLPSNLYEALKEFSQSATMREAIGDHAFKRYKEAAMYEWNEYSKYVSQWELNRYLRKF